MSTAVVVASVPTEADLSFRRVLSEGACESMERVTNSDVVDFVFLVSERRVKAVRVSAKLSFFPPLDSLLVRLLHASGETFYSYLKTGMQQNFGRLESDFAGNFRSDMEMFFSDPCGDATVDGKSVPRAEDDRGSRMNGKRFEPMHLRGYSQVPIVRNSKRWLSFLEFLRS